MNTFEATLNGDHIVVLYNGAKVVDVHDARRATGAIGLQSAHPEDPAGGFRRVPQSENQAAEIKSGADSCSRRCSLSCRLSRWIWRACAEYAADCAGASDDSSVAGTSAWRAWRCARGCSDAHDLYAAEHNGTDDRSDRGAWRRLSHAVDEQRRADSGQVSQLARHRGVRAEVPARAEISASNRAWRHTAGDSHAASRAAEWHLAPDRIGVMGFSAGGHLASTASTQFDRGNAASADAIDRASSRPDFAILGYPVITLSEPWTHQGSRTMLLGENAEIALARRLSTDTLVTADTPPTFLFHTNADTSCACGKQRGLLPRPAEGAGACRDAHLQGWRSRSRHADERHRAYRNGRKCSPTGCAPADFCNCTSDPKISSNSAPTFVDGVLPVCQHERQSPVFLVEES